MEELRSIAKGLNNLFEEHAIIIDDNTPTPRKFKTPAPSFNLKLEPASPPISIAKMSPNATDASRMTPAVKQSQNDANDTMGPQGPSQSLPVLQDATVIVAANSGKIGQLETEDKDDDIDDDDDDDDDAGSSRSSSPVLGILEAILASTQPPKPRPVSRLVSSSQRDIEKSLLESKSEFQPDGGNQPNVPIHHKEEGRENKMPNGEIDDARSGKEEIGYSTPPAAGNRLSEANLNLTGTKRCGSPSSLKEPSSKRPHTSRRRHHEFWALDGSVIIQLEDVMFRLHASELVRRSNYFAKLLGDHEKRGTLEVLENCPLYCVPGSAKDFERLYYAIDNAILFVHHAPSFEILASILRAATKYQFQTFREWAVRSLEDMWPQNIEHIRADVHRQYAVESIVLARTCDVPNILRHAFYELSRHPSFSLSEEDDEREDDDIQIVDKFLPGPGPSDCNNLGDSHSKDTLTQGDIISLIKLRNRLQTEWISTIQMVPNACGKDGCQFPRRSWYQMIFEDSLLEEGLMFDTLGGLEALCQLNLGPQKKGKEKEKEKDGKQNVPTKDYGFALCASCEAQAKKGWRRRRSKIWKQNLDLWLGL